MPDTIELRGERWVLFRGPVPIAQSRSKSLLIRRFPHATVVEED